MNMILQVTKWDAELRRQVLFKERDVEVTKVGRYLKAEGKTFNADGTGTRATNDYRCPFRYKLIPIAYIS